MTHDNGLDVLNIMARLLDLRLEFLLRRVVDLSKDVVDGSPPDFRIVLASSSLEEE